MEGSSKKENVEAEGLLCPENSSPASALAEGAAHVVKVKALGTNDLLAFPFQQQTSGPPCQAVVPGIYLHGLPGAKPALSRPPSNSRPVIIWHLI